MMGALVRLWIREHVPFLIGTAVVAVVLVLVFARWGIVGASAVAALALVLALPLGGLFDTERGAK